MLVIKYFKEIDDLKNYTLCLIKWKDYENYTISIKTLPLEFYTKHQDTFKRIEELDLLAINKLDDGKNKLFWDKDMSKEYREYGDFYSDFCDKYINNDDLTSFGLTDDGKNRLDYLVEIFEINNITIGTFDFYSALDVYLKSILELQFINPIITADTKTILSYVENSLTVAKCQNKLTDDLTKSIENLINEIEMFDVKIPIKPFEPINMKLPNAWFITPDNYLYNSMGPGGHKEANLIYPYRHILHSQTIIDPKVFIDQIKEAEEKRSITDFEFRHYTNLIYDFPCLYHDFYYDFEKFGWYKFTEKRSFNPKLVNLIIGIESAHAGLYKFFFDLKNNSSDYERNIEYIKYFELEDILIRCCGFHKILSVMDKVIVTSCINYEEEFSKYIEKGWTIDFVKPIQLNEQTGLLEEYNDDFLVIKEFTKKND